MAFTVSNLLCATEIQSSPQAMEFVELVQKRYYLAHRLESPIRVLIDSYNKIMNKGSVGLWKFVVNRTNNSCKARLLEQGTAKKFQHSLVRGHMQRIEETQSIDAVHELWSDFLAYKFIESDLFVKEMLVAMVVLYKNLIVNLNEQGYKGYAGACAVDHVQDDLQVLARESWPDTQQNHVMFQLDAQEGVYENFYSILNLLDETYDKADFVLTNNMRFYHIQRLLKPIITLLKFNAAQGIYPLSSDDEKVLEFQHEKITMCVEKMKRMKSLEPIKDLWHHFTSYKFITDKVFLREFLVLLIVTYKKEVTAVSGPHIQKDVPSADEVLQLYQDISKLQIPELLNNLDDIVEQFISIMNKYELDSSLSWAAWIRKYWWVVPVSAASLYINIYLLKKAAEPALSLDLL